MSLKSTYKKKWGLPNRPARRDPYTWTLQHAPVRHNLGDTRGWHWDFQHLSFKRILLTIQASTVSSFQSPLFLNEKSIWERRQTIWLRNAGRERAGDTRWNSSWAILNPKRWCCLSAVLNMSANLENSAVATGLKRSISLQSPKGQCQRVLQPL